MKKQSKTKLRLNSQTLRSLRASVLQDVQAGRAPPPETYEACTSDICTITC